MATVSLDTYLSSVTERLEVELNSLASTLPTPSIVGLGAIAAFRHSEHSDALLCFLKSVKLISTLNASITLLRNGFAQEVNALSRIANDCCDDIVFMWHPRGGTTLDADQERFFEDFYQEEFSNTNDVMGSRNKRSMVRRAKISAAFAHLAKDIVNPSDLQTASITVHGVLSGYIHGAYPHIMELYGGEPPLFHMRGMAGTPRQMEAANQVVTQTHRSIMIVGLVAMKLGAESTAARIKELLAEFETTLKIPSDNDPAEMMRKAKKSKAK